MDLCQLCGKIEIVTVYADIEFQRFRYNIIEKAAFVNMIGCPFCQDAFPENCDYVDVGVGYIQCTPNRCDRCGAFEQGALDLEKGDYDFMWGWVREKPNPETPELESATPSLADLLEYEPDYE